MPDVGRLEIAPDEILERLAAAVAARVRARRAAEERLGAFAFHLPFDATSGEIGAVAQSTTGVAVPGTADVDWRYFVVRALGALDDPDVVRILEALPPDGRPLEELAGLVEPAAPGRMAAADRVGRLAAAGLVGRDLESGRVSLLPLGEALLGLVAALARRAESADR